jgi:hypothetical protein
VSGRWLLKPDHAQGRLRRWAAAIITAAPRERVLSQWNQFVRQTRSAPSPRALGPPGRSLFRANRAGPTCGGAGFGGEAEPLARNGVVGSLSPPKSTTQSCATGDFLKVYERPRIGGDLCDGSLSRSAPTSRAGTLQCPPPSINERPPFKCVLLVRTRIGPALAREPFRSRRPA